MSSTDWKEPQDNINREKRLRDIRERASEANKLANKIAELSQTCDKLAKGEGFWKSRSEQTAGPTWGDMPGFDSTDQSNIRQLVMAYAEQKLREAENEFDAL